MGIHAVNIENGLGEINADTDNLVQGAHVIIQHTLLGIFFNHPALALGAEQLRLEPLKLLFQAHNRILQSGTLCL